MIWYHLYNLKNVENVHERVILLVKYYFSKVTLLVKLKPATLLKVLLLHGCFSRFLNCTNGTKITEIKW